MSRAVKPKTRSRTAESTKTAARAVAVGLSLKGPAKNPVRSVLNHRVPATRAKNLFGQLMKNASTGPVFIERHGRPQVVMVDFKTYKNLVEVKRTPDEKHLDSLRAEFDTLFAQMQTPAVRKVANDFLSASADELNKVARRPRHRG